MVIYNYAKGMEVPKFVRYTRNSEILKKIKI